MWNKRPVPPDGASLFCGIVSRSGKPDLQFLYLLPDGSQLFRMGGRQFQYLGHHPGDVLLPRASLVPNAICFGIYVL